ncbi:MAG: hypothetical protein NWE98_02425 [Candidatus Bathyarchaeota archaeon]|nr:hypothetical protein [Candidatus Bathyarchaeota archaeon]
MSKQFSVVKINCMHRKKYSMPLLSIVLIISTLAISYSLLSPTSSGQLIKTAGSESQFKIDSAYSYAGRWTANSSYVDSENRQMSLVSLYPSVTILKITRLPAVNMPSCDVILEIYDLTLTTNTGLFEKLAYGIGTNYTSSYTPFKMRSVMSHIDDLVDKKVYRGGWEAFIRPNWAENTSFMTNTIGSACIYSSHNSSLGLWSDGTPNIISIAVNRIGYLTMKDDSVTVYKDTAANTAVATQLHNQAEGFLYNSIVPAEKLAQSNLFEPEVMKQPPS